MKRLYDCEMHSYDCEIVILVASWLNVWSWMWIFVYEICEYEWEEDKQYKEKKRKISGGGGGRTTDGSKVSAGPHDRY
jgi:hypothetical protein